MRVSKFRGKRLDNGEWITGCLIKDNYGTFILPIGHCLDGIKKVDPETIGESIGCLDKNDDEIYEDDIVLLKDKHLFYSEDYESQKLATCYTYGVVKYIAPEFIVDQIREGKYGFYDSMGILFSWDELLIVGNIYDNKELMGLQNDR